MFATDDLERRIDEGEFALLIKRSNFFFFLFADDD